MILAPTSRGLFDGDVETAWKPLVTDSFQDALNHVRGRLDALREMGVTSFTLAVVTYPPDEDGCPLQYPSLTNYRDGRTYTAADLVRVVQLQEAITNLVLSHIWHVMPGDMREGDVLFVRVRVNLGHDWETTQIVGYAGALRGMYGLGNEPFILK
jgi:hypothetical protein